MPPPGCTWKDFSGDCSHDRNFAQDGRSILRRSTRSPGGSQPCSGSSQSASAGVDLDQLRSFAGRIRAELQPQQFSRTISHSRGAAGGGPIGEMISVQPQPAGQKFRRTSREYGVLPTFFWNRPHHRQTARMLDLGSGRKICERHRRHSRPLWPYRGRSPRQALWASRREDTSASRCARSPTRSDRGRGGVSLPAVDA